MHASSNTKLTFIEIDGDEKVEILHGLAKIKTIGEFQANFFVTLFSSRFEIKIRNDPFLMFRGMDSNMQCEIFIRNVVDAKGLPKKGDTYATTEKDQSRNSK